MTRPSPASPASSSRTARLLAVPARLVGALLVGGLLASGCGTGQDEATPSTPQTPQAPAPVDSYLMSTPGTGGAASPAPTGAATPGTSGGQPRGVSEVASGLRAPWGLAFLPGGDALVSERDSARVLRVPAGGGAPVPAGEVPGVDPGGEGGLLGLAVSPSFARDRLVYAYFTSATDNRVVRMPYDDGGRLGPAQVVLEGLAKNVIHNGGRIAFGPDGHLYVATGDAADRSTAQDLGSRNGKILRVTSEGAPAPGNPYENSPVYSSGHRNVQGLAWDDQGRLWASEFGQNTYDELNQIEAGRNYGWPEVEGVGGDQRYADPVATWPTDDNSPSGVAVTGGSAYLAGLRGARLWQVPLEGGAAREPRAHFEGSYGRLRTVAVAPDGALWLTTSNTDRRGEPRDGDDRILRVALG